ncbi:hypothetical protein ABZ671_06050 [Micromonospora sp. NPDC006766]|uniref:hypothetical protein n=1 Tax=Micromonospora sp. NPDC006766 TaxID=3154778 RepID=UPI00340D7F19
MATSSSAAAAKTAMAEITFAAAVIPAAWPVAQIVYMNQCDPESLIDISRKWMELYRQLDSVRQGLTDTVSAVSPEQWSGADRNAFGQHVQAYDVQVVCDQAVALLVCGTLICVASALLILVVAYVVVSTILFAFATFILAAAATVVGAPAAASAEATANSIAAEGLATLKSIEAIVETVSTVGAATIAAALAVDVRVQLSTGNTDVLKDLVQAAVDGLDNVAVGFLSKAERDFVGSKIVGGTPYGAGALLFGGGTQYVPAGEDDEGDPAYGTGGFVDNIWGHFFGEDAWNH